MSQLRAKPVRVVAAVALGVALLLIGAAGGMFLAMPSGQEGGEPRPSAVDVGFAQDMSTHHHQAVTMATLAREHASAKEIRQLAFAIETNQRDQIGRMQGWLSLWNEPAQAPDNSMQWMQGAQHHDGHHGGMGHGHGSGALMPGMATTEELEKLESLRGPEFDVYFLQLMLRHHEGGAGMAEYAAQHASLPAVRQLADNMLKSQGTESELMRAMLANRNAQPLPS